MGTNCYFPVQVGDQKQTLTALAITPPLYPTPRTPSSLALDFCTVLKVLKGGFSGATCRTEPRCHPGPTPGPPSPAPRPKPGPPSPQPKITIVLY